jgi:hypothetical protein
MENDHVKDFVRNVLGCGCDEEVFRHIDVERDVAAGDIRLMRRIKVGGRLLVYVLDADAGTIRQLQSIIKSGMEERDSSSFNRFRLVLLSDDDNVKNAVFKAFKAIIADDRVHIHVLRKDEAHEI